VAASRSLECSRQEGGDTVSTGATAIVRHADAHPLHWLRRHRHFVLVRVLVRGCEQDRFQVSSPEALSSAMRRLRPHLSSRRTSVQFSGFAEEWLPLGIGRRSREVDLADLDSALSFLAEQGVGAS
jgi:hypothetical protein